ncbi:MAG: isocitrate dehydrogenase [Xanthomonadales bacterium]|nr:isocitrate dehydrogenase [Xanthomonadales bacterium]NIN59380.1 isocitrate dehydrogenase [Xanthomonadales bacterium]NIN74731.1 isocitrate dehydrogenase [Xanthomonadales bacterium]NIO14867.1 isocitrate dehydrogenase [Xanthomonadales bacterium]NIP11773.1 isocitrate dehydrogenase [Xanthomonadales bacterium]
MNQTITVIPGDGIGPEITQATLRVLEAMGVGLEFEFVDAGLAALEQGEELIPRATLESIRRNRVALKGPLTTPVGEGFRSVNVTLRKEFDLYANVRPVVTMPGTRARYEDIDIITVRENTQGAYLAADSRVSEDGQQAESKMVVTREGCSRIAHYAFDLARRAGRRKVTIVHKANILKAVSGMFLDVAREVAGEYPDIESEEMIVDATCMRLVMDPWQFDVIVTTNLFGDIISDLCAGLVGGLGLAPGANIGTDAAMFEAVHGSAPDIAGRQIANPCALMLAAAELLAHLGMASEAARLRAAIRATLEARDRVTPDVGGDGTTAGMADAIIERLV